MNPDRLERQRDAVHTVAQSGGRGSIFEDMAKVAFAPGAVHFGPHHAVLPIGGRFDGAFNRHEETGPAGAAVELGI